MALPTQTKVFYITSHGEHYSGNIRRQDFLNHIFLDLLKVF